MIASFSKLRVQLLQFTNTWRQYNLSLLYLKLTLVFFRIYLQISLLLGALLLFAGSVIAQTATVNALTDQQCMGTRAGRNLGCTANDFTATAQFTQPPGSEITSCIAGQTITLNVISTITSGSPSRFAAGVFFGQVANFHLLTMPTCALSAFSVLTAAFCHFGRIRCVW